LVQIGGLDGEILGMLTLTFGVWQAPLVQLWRYVSCVWLVMSMCLEKASGAPELNLEQERQGDGEVEEGCDE
jgi:hypothetical protein